MSSRLPPVPSENQSHQGTGDTKQQQADVADRTRNMGSDPDKQGQQGNTKINTTHQGHQQDR